MTHGNIPVEKMQEFKVRLASLINELSLENYSDTPDFILAMFLLECLNNYNATRQRLDVWLNPQV